MIQKPGNSLVDLPYAAINLRFNPFGEMDRHHKVAVTVPRCNLPGVLEFLTGERTAVQFTGRAGSGKSTHLLMLAERLEGFHYVYLPEAQWRSVPPRQHLMVDEAQRLGRLQRHRLFQSARRIILGTHHDLAAKLESLGFSVQTICLDRPPDAAWLKLAFDKKISAAQRGSGKIPEMTLAVARDLIEEFGNNVRGMERRLYETLQKLNDNPGDGYTIGQTRPGETDPVIKI